MEGPRLPLDDLDTAAHAALPARMILQQWRRLPPVLRAGGVTLRELTLADVPVLLALLQPGEFERLAIASPASVQRMAEFVDLAREDRARGESLTLGVVPDGYAGPVGIFRVRQAEPDFGVAEWTFAIGRAFWGGGLFFSAAPIVADFAFDVLGSRRLEARVSVRNGRGNGALRRLGAVQEALLRDSLLDHGEPVDEVLWTIMADEWRGRRPSSAVLIH